MYSLNDCHSTNVSFPRLSAGYDRFSAGLGFAFWAGLPVVFVMIGGEWVAAGIAVGLASLCITPFYLYRLWDGREKLRIDGNGVIDHRSTQPTIRWDEIRTYSWKQVTRNGAVSEEYIHLALFDGTAVTLELTRLKTSIEEVSRAIDQGMHAAYLQSRQSAT